MTTIFYTIAGQHRQIKGRIIRERSDSISIVQPGKPAWATEIIFKRFITKIA